MGYESCQGEIWLASFFADAQDRKFCLSVAAFLHPLLHIIRVFPVLTEFFPWLPYERPGSGDWLGFLNSPDSFCRLIVLSDDLLRGLSSWP